MTDSRWALRVHAACDWVSWAASLNALWLIGTLAGGVVGGIGPATAAAMALTRRRLRGDRVRVVSEFRRSWAREFAGSQITVGIPIVVASLLAAHAATRLSISLDGGALALTGAAVLAGVVATVSAAMHAHYDLPRRAHVLTASRWVLRNPGPALLLLAAAASVAAATAAVPALALFVSAGAWLSASTAMCLGFFAANDAALTPTNEGVPS